jgi:hypothetical protein
MVVRESAAQHDILSRVHAGDDCHVYVNLQMHESEERPIANAQSTSIIVS